MSVLAAGQGDHEEVRESGCGLSETKLDDVTFVVRHYETTPESHGEALPIVTPAFALAYEGRVDNRSEIAFALAKPTLAREADSRILAEAFAAWGPALSARVIGEYSYVAYDRRTRQIVAGQDSIGVRRVFYGTSSGRFVVTSNLALLFRSWPELRPAYDPDVLPEYFAGAMSPWSGRTIWRGIRELTRGNALVARAGRVEERQVWRPGRARQQRYSSSQDVAEAFRQHLFEAVRSSLRASGPVFCDLSGGYDSSTIYSIAALLVQAGESAGPVIGLSFVNRRSDEVAFQEAVRQHTGGMESYTLDLSDYPPFCRFTDCELPTGGFLQTGALDQATRQLAAAHGARSHLTGQGADALYQKRGGGTPVYLADWFREGRFREWCRHFSAYLQGGGFSAWHLLRTCTFGSLDLHAGMHAPLPDWLTPRFRDQIQQTRLDFQYAHPRTFRSTARERTYRWTSCFIPYPGESITDERLPLLHRPLVDFLLGLDWVHLMRPNEERVLMRNSLQGILPDMLLSGRCRTAFGATLYEGLRRFWPRIASIVTGTRLAELGVVELKPFQTALSALRAGYDGPNSQITKTALYLETWLGLKATLNDGQQEAVSDTTGTQWGAAG